MRIGFGDIDKAREDPDWQRVLAWGTKIEGTEPNHYKVELNSPLWKWVQQAEEALLQGMGNISSELMNMAGVAISGANGCAYCFGAWCQVLTHFDNTPEGKVASLARYGADSPLLNAMESDVIRFVLKAQAEPENVTDEDLDRLRAHGLDDSDLLNLVHLVDVVSFSNRVNTIFKTPIDESYKRTLNTVAPDPEKNLAAPFARMVKDVTDRRALGEEGY